MLVERMTPRQTFENWWFPDPELFQLLDNRDALTEQHSLAQHLNPLFIVTSKQQDPSEVFVMNRVFRLSVERLAGKEGRLAVISPYLCHTKGKAGTGQGGPFQADGLFK